MRTEAEVKAAAEAFAWFIASGRITRQLPENRDAIVGSVAAIEWMLGDDGENPVAHTLKCIAAMRAGPERN